MDDILQELGPLMKPVDRSADEKVYVPRELNLNELERQVLNYLSIEPMHLDEILRESELELSRTLSTLTILEMKRLARRLHGGYVVRTTQ